MVLLQGYPNSAPYMLAEFTTRIICDYTLSFHDRDCLHC